MTTRREFLRNAAFAAGGLALAGKAPRLTAAPQEAAKSRVVSVAAEDMLVDTQYNPAAVARSFEAGMRELTGQKTGASAWASLFSPDDVVGIKINGIGAPRISSSRPSIDAAIAGLKSAGVRENNIIVWDRTEGDLRKAGLAVNKGPEGPRVMGTCAGGEVLVPWVQGFDRGVFVSYPDGTLARFRELRQTDFFKRATFREIFNSMTWLWTLSQLGNEKAKKFGPEMRRLYTATAEDREGILKIVESVAGDFDDVTIPDEDKSYLALLATQTITKLVNIAVLKHNEDSGVTWATKNIALGVTTNKVRFHIDYCARAIPDILALPALRDKMTLHIGEAARISTVSVAGARLAFDKWIFFSRDPVALDRLGLDILENKRRAQDLESIRSIATHVAACAQKGLGTDDLSKIDWRAIEA